MKLVLKCSSLIDGASDRPMSDAMIVIDSGKIEYAGPSQGCCPENTIDAEGYTAMPGLIDCHVHLTSGGDPRRQQPVGTPGAEHSRSLATAMENMRKSLLGGVTTVRDLGAPNDIIFTLRDMERSGDIIGPAIVASGMCITTTGGHGYRGGHQCDCPIEVRKAARAQLRDGADVVKIMSSGGVFTALSKSGNCQYTVEELHEAVAEAEKMGKRVATHVHAAEAIQRALLAGIHSIEHGIFLDDECIEVMLKMGAYLVPTLAPHRYIWGNRDKSLIPQVFLSKASAIVEPNFTGARKAIAAGVRIAAGTDSGIPFMEHGRVITEVETLADLGMSPMDAIKSATSRAAELLQIGDSAGSLSTGRVADVILVKGDPLTDLSLLRNPALVIHRGRVVAHNPGSGLGVSCAPGVLVLSERGNWPDWRYV